LGWANLGGAAGAIGAALPRRRLARWRTIEFVLARRDFGQSQSPIEPGAKRRRGGGIDLGRGALDLFGLALLVLHLGLAGRRRVLKSATAARRGGENGVVELAGERQARRGPPRRARLRCAARALEICSICLVIESSRW